MITPNDFAPRYDAVIVGARAAGASTALLLARQGLRVLAVDRGRYGTDTLSTHALMRGGVLQLARWGVLPRVLAAGTPPVRRATFIYGDEAVAVPVKPKDGVDALYAPRRTVLDRMIVDAAAEAGADVAYSTRLVDLQRDEDGRVCGITLAGDDGRPRSVATDMVIGADGLRSAVARLVNAEVTHSGQWAAANVFGYWSGLPVDGYRWYYAPGMSVGTIPTNDGLTCVFASVPASRFAELFREDIRSGYELVLRATGHDLVSGLQAAVLVGSLHGFPGQIGFVRRSAGPGWALVGDAAYFKDPITAHGITDALIDAEGLANAVAAGTDHALADYEMRRNERALALFDITDRIASFAWTLEGARALHKRLAEEMAREVKSLNRMALEETAV
jgi:2-polyprenyl-6-methoxyphenol hydroxylase-like FAD-dependent oxidoreductase